MSSTNRPRPSVFTREGAKAKQINPELQLRRSIMSCLLWEDQFYDDGMTIGDRIASLIPMVSPDKVASMALQAREDMKLRHIPLHMACTMAPLPKHSGWVKDVLGAVIQRPDELSEFLALYWKNGKCPLSGQVKKGLAKAFLKFDEYQLAKYNRDNAIKLKDVLFLCHAKPKDEAQAALWKRLINGTMKTPDTWEVSLSAKDGVSKKDKWERLLREKKLGAMALLRNLRNFEEAKVDENLVIEALRCVKPDKVLPFRFIAAAKHAPQWEPYIEHAMLKCLSTYDKIPGKTTLIVDVSGSMDEQISSKSEITRMDAACGIAILARELCEKVDIVTFSMTNVRVAPRRGFALRDAIVTSQDHSGSFLGAAVKSIYTDKQNDFQHDFAGYGGTHALSFKGLNLNPDRLIVMTDEQSHDKVPDPQCRGYMINVASSKNGVGYGAWFHVDGWSEAVIQFIQELEKDVHPLE
jgi:hypothetical protein